jgi:hypothetical protein
MGTGFPGQAALGFLRAFLGIRMSRIAEARQSKDLGASAIELAIITAVLVGLAATVLIVIYNIVNTQTAKINSNNGQIP